MVMAVPKTVVNDRVSFEGALPEAAFVDAVLGAVNGTDGAAGAQRTLSRLPSASDSARIPRGSRSPNF